MAVKRIVVVGCGSIGVRHARLLARRSDLLLELCDSNAACLADAVAQIGNRPCFEDYRAMLATLPDAVVIATPHACHADQLIAAVESGIHVLCEKPMSDSLRDALRMAEAAARASSVVDFGFTLHFHPGLLRLKSLIAAGELGRIVHMYCRVGTYATLACSRTRHQAHVEGALLMDYVHQPDILHWLSGREPAGVYMSASRGGELPLTSNPNVADIVLDYDGALRAAIHINYVQAPQRHEYEVVGDRAWALLDAESNSLRVGSRERDAQTTETFQFERDELFEAEHQAFLDAVEGTRGPESPCKSALVSMRVVDAALRSWKQSARVALS
ncbi:MAG: Gfo/Idh/MocA family oxidoreductase [Candidatus Hydrogenedentes bacterium]|nr:Gfo/Idh/MocA family oxidoreductase [Candidatus Hydrogenedentota bacterium]